MVRASQNEKERIKQSSRKLEDGTGKNYTALGLDSGSAPNMTLG